MPNPMRDYLVWVSANHGKMRPRLHSAERLYDIALHDYGAWTAEDVRKVCEAEYYLPSPHTEKFETAAGMLPALPPYKYVAFLDDDLDIDTYALNSLFLVGDNLRLDLFQPALTNESFGSHAPLYQAKYGKREPVRLVPFVEIMAPFFSKKALGKLIWSFDLNQSAWGLDCFIWKQHFDCYVIDAIPMGHYRQPVRRDRVMRNGLTPFQECDIIQKMNYDGDTKW
jgi:hypothetical protein